MRDAAEIRPARLPAIEGAPASTRRGARALLIGGTDGNERLTVQTGALLFVLLAVLGVTIVRIGQLLWLHLFLGLLLLGPVALKMASTGYRFARYYTSDATYREKGPPFAPLRVLAPLVVASTVVVFATGVVLVWKGPGVRDTWLLPHKAAFFVWLAATSLHVLGHLPEIRRGLLGARRTRAEVLAAAGAGAGSGSIASGGAPSRLTVAGYALAARLPGSYSRALALAGAIAVGLVIALVFIPHFAPWVEGQHLYDHHH